MKGQNSSIPNYFLTENRETVVSKKKNHEVKKKLLFSHQIISLEFYSSNEILKKYKLIWSQYMFCTLQSKRYLEWKPIQFKNLQLEKSYRNSVM